MRERIVLLIERLKAYPGILLKIFYSLKVPDS
jgi:hypothetical protein